MSDTVTLFSADGTGSAEFSPCGQYRYVLKRRNPIPLRWVRPILFIMLNPSTADQDKTDPTVRRCIFYAGRCGGTELTVVNLFALRSTDPKNLLTHPKPVGPFNDEKIEKEIDRASKIILAWGSHRLGKVRGKELLEKFGRKMKGKTFCLARTKDGQPRHPLYLRNDLPLIEVEL
jgi:hypothetical protein